MTKNKKFNEFFPKMHFSIVYKYEKAMEGGVWDMKKRVISLALLVLMLLSVTVQATTKATFATPVLTFDGKTALCCVEVSADRTTDKIDITASLWRGSTCLATWTESGYEYVCLNESKDVSIRGVTYTLKADVTVNGKALPQFETSAKCPLN